MGNRLNQMASSSIRNIFLQTLALGLIAFGLSIGAASRGYHETEDAGLNNECFHKRGVSSGLAVSSAIILLVAQLVVYVVTSCTCCSPSSQRTGYKVGAIIVLVLSWICFVIAEYFLWYGARLRYFEVAIGEVRCDQVMQAVFAIGSTFSLLTLLLNAGYYGLYSKSTKTRMIPRDVDPEQPIQDVGPSKS